MQLLASGYQTAMPLQSDNQLPGSAILGFGEVTSNGELASLAVIRCYLPISFNYMTDPRWPGQKRRLSNDLTVN